jgi:hypothetical protein
MQTIRKHRYILEKIVNAKPIARRKMLLRAPAPLFNVFKLLCKLITDGHVKIGKAKRHKALAKKIGTSNVKAIKAIAEQRGGALASIIGGVLPFLAPLISKVFK